MALMNKYGENISYDCTELIEELKADIKKYGGERIVEVITEERAGVKIYKDYKLKKDETNIVHALSSNEKVEKVTATALLTMYEMENSII